MTDIAPGPDLVAPVLAAGRRRRFKSTIVVGGALVGLTVVVAVISFAWTPHDAVRVSLDSTLRRAGAAGHLLGTDQFGRDVLSMLMVGARTTLFVGIIAVVIALALGLPLGALAAMRRGWIEELVMRSADIIYAFPALLIAILLTAAFGPSTLSAMTAIGISFVPVFARVTRSAALQVVERDFVTAARSFGVKGRAIFTRHVLPNIGYVLIVQATIAFALAILAEAALSYLGLGTPPPTPSWGRMLREAQTFAGISPGLAVWPGLAIASAVLGFNLLGDGLRDALDPRLTVEREQR